ncbi:ATP-binding protein [Halopenitus persicus]|uniref:AAA+ ATPase domain-containing protein n=1 Tax=Halopenitus persicus TaxID=1048396 RepID=A0A1H3FR46_9EURY|nr:DUF87 domain-containing protein [Halopenitus persicus]QHS16756.1 DUF87 domain-containing protein [haloarchaeon 3A1-DGR]SDX93335.1 hypothetical protein SAMN05216564_102172 [Halopenitus persicus]
MTERDLPSSPHVRSGTNSRSAGPLGKRNGSGPFGEAEGVSCGVSGTHQYDSGSAATNGPSDVPSDVSSEPTPHVLGREPGSGGPIARLGAFLARDGSTGAPVGIDLDGPHAGVLVGKRGTGKSYTLGVLAEEIAATVGVSPIVLDPMGVFEGIAALPDGRVLEATIHPESLPPDRWPEIARLDPDRPPGSLLWRVVEAVADGSSRTSLSAIREAIADADAPAATKRTVENHLDLLAAWDVFDADAPSVGSLIGGGPTVVDCRSLPPAATKAIGYALARGIYDHCVGGTSDVQPWLLVDEAHAFLEGLAADAFRTLFTRGRAPGVSVVCATQRPSALPPVAVSQSDLVIAHRLTDERDVDALRVAQPTYLADDLGDTLPAGVGRALVVDDATEGAHTVRVRERHTVHGGASPSVSDR